MHPFLRRAFLGQNCAYYMQDFTVIFSLFYHTDPFHLNFYLFMYCICKCFLFLPCLFCEMTRDNCHTTWMICHPPPRLSVTSAVLTFPVSENSAYLLYQPAICTADIPQLQQQMLCIVLGLLLVFTIHN